ncbi:MAG: PTS sugar transporter subunit IIA [Clostridia bacterium]|nr:PTS sugar transporter subunit IIA [Clostridia bacterium]
MSFSFFGKKEKQAENCAEKNTQINSSEITASNTGDVLILENIQIGQKSVSKEEAIEMAGQLLVDSGYVMPEYIDAMKEREKVLSTYIGEGIAIPHGVGAAKDKIIKTGISVVQFPEGVVFGEGNKAFLVVGIAGKGNEHMKILTNLAEFIQEGITIKELFTTEDNMRIFNAFTSKL